MTRQRLRAAVDGDEDRHLDVGELRRIRAQVEFLPPAPWLAVELTDFDLRGPRVWDEDLQPSREAHEREERLRREHAAWRGVRAADGTLVAGEPVAGGSPARVVDPAWLFLAEARLAVPRLLATLRPLWKLRDLAAPAPAVAASSDSNWAGPVRRAPDDEALGRAAFEAVPAPTSWRELPELVRGEWRARALAVRSMLEEG